MAISLAGDACSWLKASTHFTGRSLTLAFHTIQTQTCFLLVQHGQQNPRTLMRDHSMLVTKAKLLCTNFILEIPWKYLVKLNKDESKFVMPQLNELQKNYLKLLLCPYCPLWEYALCGRWNVYKEEKSQSIGTSGGLAPLTAQRGACLSHSAYLNGIQEAKLSTVQHLRKHQRSRQHEAKSSVLNLAIKKASSVPAPHCRSCKGNADSETFSASR